MFNDILAPANPDAAAVIRVDYANTVDAADGYIVSLRAINYAGPGDLLRRHGQLCDAAGDPDDRAQVSTA